jgi:hypothetical protein
MLNNHDYFSFLPKNIRSNLLIQLQTPQRVALQLRQVALQIPPRIALQLRQVALQIPPRIALQLPQVALQIQLQVGDYKRAHFSRINVGSSVCRIPEIKHTSLYLKPY